MIATSDPSINRAERDADFWLFGGVFRPVYLEIVPAESIERVAIDADMNRRFTVDVYPRTVAQADRVVVRIETLDGRHTKDIVRAYAWYQLAILHGQAYATHLRDELVKQMTPTQITDGQSLARTLQAEIRRGGGTSGSSTTSTGGTTKK